MKRMKHKQKRMKTKINYVIVLSTLFIGINVSAQKFTVESMKMELEDRSKPDSDKDFESLMKWAEETKTNTKTSNDPRMWYYRGLTYLKVSTLNNELSKSNPDAIYIAHEAFQNAIKTDAKKRVTEESEANLLNVAIGLYNKGYTAYQTEEYKESYRNFEMAVPLMKYDTEGQLKRNNLTVEVLEQMMAFSAMNGGEDEKAKKALQVLVNKGTAEGSIYANLAKLQLKGGDTTAALSTIMSGKDMNEADKTLINMELDIYLKQGRSKELIEKLNGAIADDPDNTIYYFARAISYEGLGENDKAAADYDKILEIDPEYYDASYNKGVMYLNRVAEIVEELDGVYKPSIIEKSEAEINIEYKKAIVEFENVFNNNDDMKLTDKVELAGTMKKIYARLEQMEKYAEMKSFIESN
jgi:tetratricopeptide (TPR) repeat protein